MSDFNTLRWGDLHEVRDMMDGDRPLDTVEIRAIVFNLVEHWCKEHPVTPIAAPVKESWETTTRYGRADLTLHKLIREAYKVACLIERCGASVELTRASSTAFSLVEELSDEFKARQTLKKNTLYL